MQIAFFFATFDYTVRELTGPRGVSIFDRRRPGNNQGGYRSSERPENGKAGTHARKHADPETARAIASTGTNSGAQGNTRRQITRGGVALADQTETLFKKSFWGVGGRISTGLNPFRNHARRARVPFVPGVLRSARILGAPGPIPFNAGNDSGTGREMSRAYNTLYAPRARGPSPKNLYVSRTRSAAHGSRALRSLARALHPGG